MMMHRKIQEQLYDYLHDDVTDTDRKMIDRHLADCRECADVAASLRSSLKLVGPGSHPADQLPPEFWNSFASKVERRIQQDIMGTSLSSSLWEKIVSVVMAHQNLATSLGAAIATIGIVMLLWNPWQDIQPPPMITDNPPTVPVSTKPDKVSQYFRKSKTLLVGLSNLRMVEDQNIDLSVEQQVSRELVHESRSLRQEGLDPHSAFVVKDLEKILIELANIEKPRIEPQMELIRDGIQQENLLFRLRMAEAMRDSMQFIFASNN